MEYKVKELTKNDLNNLESLFETLSNLTKSPLQSKERTEELLSHMNAQGSKIFVAITPEGEYIGSLTLLIEHKMTRG